LIQAGQSITCLVSNKGDSAQCLTVLSLSLTTLALPRLSPGQFLPSPISHHLSATAKKGGTERLLIALKDWVYGHVSLAL
jgi:hypothetical protein